MNNNLAAHLRAWGLKVIEQPGWQNRGRPRTFRPRAIIVHHDASSTKTGNFGARNFIVTGSSALPGPLSQFLLARDGTVVVIAGGSANHAGTGGPKAGIPANQANNYAWGIEAANNGAGEKWPAAQINAYYRLCAALMDYSKITDVNKVIGHKEWTRRKIDPAGINMNTFRKNVAAALKDGKKGGTTPPVSTNNRMNPKAYYIGAKGEHVTWLGQRLVAHGFGKHYSVGPGPTFSEADRKNVQAFQLAQGWKGTAKGQDADGFPGNETLKRLAAAPKTSTASKPKPTTPALSRPFANPTTFDQKMQTAMYWLREAEKHATGTTVKTKLKAIIASMKKVASWQESQ